MQPDTELPLVFFVCYRVFGKENISTSSTFKRRAFMCGLTGRSREPREMRIPRVEETRLNKPVLKGQQQALGDITPGCCFRHNFPEASLGAQAGKRLKRTSFVAQH
jgi:hypothetical protein